MRSILWILCIAFLLACLVPASASNLHSIKIDDWQHGSNLHLLGDIQSYLCDGLKWEDDTWNGLPAFNMELFHWWEKPFELPAAASANGALHFGVFDCYGDEGYADPVYWDGQLLGYLPNYPPNGSGPASYAVPANLLTAGPHTLRIESSYSAAYDNWDDFTFYDISVNYPAPEPRGILALAAGFCSLVGLTTRAKKRHHWS